MTTKSEQTFDLFSDVLQDMERALEFFADVEKETDCRIAQETLDKFDKFVKEVEAQTEEGKLGTLYLSLKTLVPEVKTDDKH